MVSLWNGQHYAESIARLQRISCLYDGFHLISCTDGPTDGLTQEGRDGSTYGRTDKGSCKKKIDNSINFLRGGEKIVSLFCLRRRE